ncbi:MAG TPA: DUF3352 domain-containing protein [Solirubrobacterales bacterium]|nr:DUF3352 domain-containing protein [Solirubrobacterales bacterium]
MKLRLVHPVLLAVVAALVVAGCGGGSDDGGSGTDPAGVALPQAPVFIDFAVQPEGEASENLDALAKQIAGIDDLGELIVTELESSASDDGEELDFEKEVEPWLGERGGLFLQEYDGDDFEGYGAAVQTTDEDAARDFVDKQLESGDEEARDGSYEGVDYKVQEDETTIGVFDGLVAFAEDEAIFKAMVDASGGENLGADSAYADAVSNAPDESVADVYVDIGALIEESGGEIDSEAETFLDSVGIEPEEATAVASLVPGSNQIEIDLSTDLSGENPPSGDASELLGSLPATSVGAFAAADFGKRFAEGIDRIDAEGIPSEGIGQNQLKKALKQGGIDLDSITSSVGDAGGYVTGNSERSLGGALVLETDDADQAKTTVSNLGLFLRSTGTSGITKITEGASGFSVRSPELGRQPVVVVAKGSRIAIGYGLAPTLSTFQDQGKALANTDPYNEALDALDDTPIAMYVDGPASLRLAKALVPPGEEEFEAAEQYLQKIDYLALGSEASGDLATAKLIVGVK